MQINRRIASVWLRTTWFVTPPAAVMHGPSAAQFLAEHIHVVLQDRLLQRRGGVDDAHRALIAASCRPPIAILLEPR
jgi:hypothetical protein